MNPEDGVKKRVLLVDDEKELCDKVKKRLEYEGFEVDVAHDGIEALGMYALCLSKDPYHAIILDIMMPRLDGKETLKAIRQLEADRHVTSDKSIPVIMLTADNQSYMDSYKQGCDDYIMKPFDSQDLVGRVKTKIEFYS